MTVTALPVEAIDHVRAEYHAKRITRSDALAAIRSAADVTLTGAADLLLDDPRTAASRYSRGEG